MVDSPPFLPYEPVSTEPLTFARRLTLTLYSRGPIQETPMAEAKAAKTPTVPPMVRFTPAEVARNKKARDGRRKSIRAQNASSRMK